MGLPRFVKHCAAIVVRGDKGFGDMVRGMAAGILKTLAVWVEREIASGENPARQQLVVQVRAAFSNSQSRFCGCLFANRKSPAGSHGARHSG